MSIRKLGIHYRGSLFWIIFWAIFFFPIAFVLFFTDVDFMKGGTKHHLRYDGSKFWLGFWVMIFFPIAFFLMIHNGFTIRSS